MKIGNVLRDFRKKTGLTLNELSRKSGVALATLSRIENGKMTGTIKAHQRICRSLGVSIAEVYRELEESGKTIDRLPREERAEHFMHSRKASYELLVTHPEGKGILPLMIKLGAGGETPTEKEKPGSDKLLYLMTGSIKVFVGKNEYLMKKGDSLYFDASLPHYMRNESDRPSEAICVVTPWNAN